MDLPTLAASMCQNGDVAFIQTKSEEVHEHHYPIWDRFTVVEHTRTINRMRGLLAEFGIIAAQGTAAFKDRWLKLRLDHADSIPPLAWQTLDAWYEQLLALYQKVLAFDRQIKQFVREDARALRLAQVNGIGPITASAIVATVGNGRDFKNGRQFAAGLKA